MAKIKLKATDGTYQWFDCVDFLKTDDGYISKFVVRASNGDHTYLYISHTIADSAKKMIAGSGGGGLFFGPWGMAIGAAIGFLKDLYDRDDKPEGYYHSISGNRLDYINKIYYLDTNWFMN